jgi:hypothetical protein
MIGAIMGVGSGKSFSSVGILSTDRPLEICSEISAFPMATHRTPKTQLDLLENHKKKM